MQQNSDHMITVVHLYLHSIGMKPPTCKITIGQ